jgi:subtilisin family serine protease
MLSKNYYASLANGCFRDTSLSDLDTAFDNFRSTSPAAGWVIHFHGGTVKQSSALEMAEALQKTYLEAGGHPFFFVWESGLWETFRNNLQEISQETLFKKLVSYLVEYLLGKLGLDPSVAAAESLHSGQRPQQEVEQWIEAQQQEAPLPQQAPTAPYDGVRNEEAANDLTGDEVSAAELNALMQDDPELNAEIDRLNAKINQPVALNEATESGLGYKTPGHLSPEALSELTGTNQLPREVLPSANESLLGSITVARVATAAARIGYRVIRRYMGGRDHGLYSTVVEEVLRDLYVGGIGSSLFWDQMKRDTLDAFGEDGARYGGTAFLETLEKQIKSTTPPPRVTLVGHSAGAIFASHFLLHAHRKLPANFKFDVIFLAPAVDFELFNQAVQTGRIANFRMFAMRDELEAHDAFLAPYAKTLKYVYPKSLLYIVSGLLEVEVDRPLVGMERYYPGRQYQGRLFAALQSVRQFLARGTNRVVWSQQTSDVGGLSSRAIHHGDFDREDADTLASVQYILRQGFGADAAGPSLEESVALEPVSYKSSEFVSRGLTETIYAKSNLNINEDRVVKALAALPPEQLTEVYERVCAQDELKVAVTPNEQFGWHMVDQARKSGRNVEDLLIEANRAVPTAGLVQQFLPPENKISRSLKEQLAATPEFGVLESVVTEPPVSTMTLRLRSPDVSLEGVPGLKQMSKVGTIVVARGTPETLQALEQNPDVLTVSGPSRPAFGECVRSMPRIKADVAKARVKENGSQCLVAVIDGGIDPLHHAFCKPEDQTQTRLVGIWDLTDNTGPPPAGFEAVGGTWHAPADINRYIQNGVLEKQLRRDPLGHGTHVTSIAAGSQQQAMLGKFPGGAAHEAPILAIIVGDSEYEIGSPSQLGYSETHVSALAFCQHIAEQHNLPVVVNISQGQQSGAHDGTTHVEVAIDNFTDGGRKPGYVVIKSAGNDRDGLGHAYVTMTAGSQENLEWVSDVQRPGRRGRLRDLIEVWFDPSRDMSFQLVNPNAEPSVAVNFTNNYQSGKFSNGNSYSLDYAERFRDNGHGRLRIEIKSGDAPAIRDGKWQLEIGNAAANQPQEIHAWVERTDWQPVKFANFPSVDTTLTIPGTARSVITVAAVHPGPSVRVARFSGFGCTRTKDEKPEIAAPGVDIWAAKSGTKTDFASDNGTSMAAPHVAGAIALLLSACKKKGKSLPGANEIRACFKKLCPTNKWDRGLGFGVLDVDALLKDFGL